MLNYNYAACNFAGSVIRFQYTVWIGVLALLDVGEWAPFYISLVTRFT